MASASNLRDRISGKRIGVNPDRWGRHLWESLHYITLGYPEDNPSVEIKRSAYDFVTALQFLLPCQTCREHLVAILRNDMPLTDDVLSSRRSFGEYIVRLRDYVKRQHVLQPGSYWPTHTFDADVAERLLGPPSALDQIATWWLVLAIPMALFKLAGGV